MTEELPTFIGRMFPISEKREDTFIIGTSMGGFGAYRIALEQPERFSAVASLSGTLDMISMAKMYNNDETGAFDNIFKREDLRPGSQHDLMALINKHIQEGRQLPKFYQCCGTEDSMYGMYTSFRDRFKELGLDFTYDEDPGVHNWVYWDSVIEKVLDWLPLANGLVEG